MVTKRIPKPKVSESTRYRMEADTVSGVAEIEKKVIKDTKEKKSKSGYPFKLKVSFRNRIDCDRFAKLIQCDINASKKEIDFKVSSKNSKVVCKFVGEPKNKPNKKGLSEFHAKHWKGMPEFEQEDSVPRKERNYVTEDVSPVQQCSNRRYLKIDKTDELVWDTVVEVLAKSHRFKDEVKNQVFGSSTTNESTQDDLRTLKRTQSRLKKEIVDETNSIVSLETDKILKKRNANEISRILENLDSHRLELEQSLEKVTNEILRIESKTQWVDWLTKFGDRITALSDFSPQDKQSFLTGILEKIEVSTVNTQEHSLVFYFKVPYVNDKIEWTKGKSGKRKYRIDGGESILFVEIDSSKKSPSLRA